MFEKIKKALANCSSDGSIYLVEKLSSNSGFFMTNKHLLYMVYNFENIPHQSLATEFLRLNTNVEIVSIKNNQMFSTGKYNVLEILPVENLYENSLLESFVKLCKAHTEFMEAKSFVKFFYSLTNLFQMPREQQYKNLVGLFGELSFMDCLCKTYKIDLSNCWHKTGSRDKYEFVLKTKNLEVKTTASIDEEISIKHSQLFNEECNYLIVVCVEESNSGKTLNQLIDEMKKDLNHYNNFNFALNIERERRKVSPVDADIKRFSVKSISVYYADDINPFEEIPDCVSHLTYKIDLIGKKQILQDNWRKEFNDV